MQLFPIETRKEQDNAEKEGKWQAYTDRLHLENQTKGPLTLNQVLELPEHDQKEPQSRICFREWM